jgi:hypothetical protein
MRLVAANLCLANLLEALENGSVLHPWFAREKFAATFVDTDRVGDFEAWLALPVVEIGRLAQCAITGVARLPAEDAANGCSFSAEYGTDALSSLILLKELLEGYGLGEIALRDLVLPWEELGPDGQYAYSEARRVERVEQLYRVAAEAYRSICSGLSSEVCEHFFFSQWPCRAVVAIEMVEGDPSPGSQMFWELCEDWDSGPAVRIVRDRSTILRSAQEWEERVQTMREQCAAWGRRFHSLQSVSGRIDWSFSADAVTELVAGLLKADIEELKRLLNNGM